MSKKIEQIILKNLLNNEPYARKVLPFLQSEYFNQDKSEKVIFEEISKFILLYNTIPSIEAIEIAVSEKDNLFEGEAQSIEKMLDALKQDTSTEVNQEWLSNETLKFCQEKALHNAISESIQILNDKSGKQQKDKGAIPQILTDALSITFDPNVGHDFTEDADERYESYHQNNKKYPFDIDFFNKITGGGVEEKTMTVILAGTNVGKTLMMCHFAAAFYLQHLNVLYITLEMSEKKIGRRIDANLLDVNMNDLRLLSKESYDKKIARVKAKTKGRLIIREFPTASASTIHFRALMNELYLKKQFKPDVIFVDYLAICASARLKPGVAGMYAYVKAISEELRGFATEFKVPLFTGAQSNRVGYLDSDPGLEHTAESFGLPATADLMFVVTTSDVLAAANQLMVKQLKNRDEDVNKNRKFVVGVDRRSEEHTSELQSLRHLVCRL